MNPFVISLTVRLTALLIAGGLITVALRRSTYAVRHIVIAATLACVVALPAAMILVPEWRVAVLPSAPTTIDVHAVVTAKPTDLVAPSAPSAARGESVHPVLVTSELEPASPRASHSASSDARSSFVQTARALTAPQIVLIVWLAGVLVGLLWITAGRIGLARIRRNATPLSTYEWRAILESEAMHAGVSQRVALHTSASVSTPVTWGILSPVIVLPEASLAWTPDRKRVVIMHEMAHIARRDAATQLVATFASVAYWLHPLVLLAARRLRAECERACDERVLERGTSAADYAAHLLEVAKLSRSFGAASIMSVAMARPSQLEGRLLAVLRAEPRSARTTARTRVLAALSAAAMLLAVSAFKPVGRDVHTRTIVHTTLAPVTLDRDGTLPTPSATRHAQASRSALVDTGLTVDAPEAPPSPAIPAPPSSLTFPSDPVSPPASVSPPAPAVTHFEVGAPSTPDAPFAIPAAPTASRAPSPVAIAIAPVAPLSAFSVFDRIAPLDPTTPANPARSDSTFHKSVSARKGGTLEIDLDAGGDIEIIGTNDDKVTVDGSLGGRDWRDMTVDLEAHDGDASLTSRYVGRSSTQVFDNEFKIRVPKHFDVRVNSAGGNVSISGVDGAFSGTTAGGTIELAHANGNANLSTGGGNIHVSNSHLDGSVTTGGGTVNLQDVTGGLTGASGSSAFMKEGFEFHWPEFAKMPRLAQLPKLEKMRALRETDRVAVERAMGAMERQQDAMRRAQDAMERDGGAIERAQKIAGDAGTRRSELSVQLSEQNLQRIAKEMARNQVLVDSVHALVERSMKSVDTTNMRFRYDYGPRMYDPESLRSDSAALQSDAMGSEQERKLLERSLETLQDPNRLILIDKNGGPIRVVRGPKGARLGAPGSVTRIDGAEDAASAITGGGDITVSAGKDKAHPVDVSSGKGNVVVSIPRGADVTLDLETAYTENFGRPTKIEGDVPLETTESASWDSTHGSPRKYVRVKQKLGKGGALIRVRTVNGDIKLKVAS